MDSHALSVSAFILKVKVVLRILHLVPDYFIRCYLYMLFGFHAPPYTYMYFATRNNQLATIYCKRFVELNIESFF